MGFFLGAVLLFFSWTVNAMVLRAVENLLAVRRLQNEIQALYGLRQENRDIRRLGLQYEQERKRILQDCMSRLDKACEMLKEKEDFGTVRNSFLQPHIHKPCVPSGIQGGQDAPVAQGGVAVYSGIGPVKGGIIAEARL